MFSIDLMKANYSFQKFLLRNMKFILLLIFIILSAKSLYRRRNLTLAFTKAGKFFGNKRNDAFLRKLSQWIFLSVKFGSDNILSPIWDLRSCFVPAWPACGSGMSSDHCSDFYLNSYKLEATEPGCDHMTVWRSWWNTLLLMILCIQFHIQEYLYL